MVVSRHGKYRFQTGMVTASLLNKGLRMADAAEIARAVRDQVAGTGEISSDDLSAEVDRLIQERLGETEAQNVRERRGQAEDNVPMVQTARGRFPFSRGVILRHLDTAGLNLDAATRVVRELEAWVRSRDSDVLTEEELHRVLAKVLAMQEGEAYARRFRLTDWVSHSDTPIIILIGGATGTGKSTLAMELAYRLGVVWVTSTDMVRETMRTVLSPDLVPGLHDHSFRGIVVGGQVLSDPRERVLAGFRQQAGQVAVGVRAVIQRAIRENAHVIIEGTHIAPPFRQYVPPGTTAHLAGFILAVPDEKQHRKRFPQRSKDQADRPAETYLDAFQSVRWIHEDLLRMAEDAEAVVLPNVDLSRTLMSAVDFLSRELPVDEESPNSVIARRTRSEGHDVPTLFLVLDGLGDEPNPALGGKTPLEAADTPFLRRLAGSGGQGQVRTTRPEVETPSTDEGMMALLGGLLDDVHIARGAFEALGQGLPIPPDSVLFRGNLATLESDDSIIDRRAGRIREGVEDLLADLKHVPLSGGIIGRVYPGHEHRVLLMLVGTGLSPAVSDTDPGDRTGVQRSKAPRALDDSPEAGRTADALRELLGIVRRHLEKHPLNEQRVAQGLRPANAIITRGAASPPPRMAPQSFTGAMVAGCRTALGVARHLGFKTATSVKMTGNLDTDLDAKFETAGALFEETDFVVVHLKGTDVAGHDRRPFEKRDFISAVDAALGRFLTARPALSQKLRIVVSADHGTSSLSGSHIPNPVPLLFATWNADAEEEEDFDEESTARGALGVLESGELAELLGLTDDEDERASLRPAG